MDHLESFEGNYFGFRGVARDINGASSASSSSLLLNNKRGEFIMKPRQKMGDADKANKASIALRNHCDAERRRRERINRHLATLRTLTHGTTKVCISFSCLPTYSYYCFPHHI